MFGYVKVYKDELKIKEYNLFKAYYCGLCKALGKRFGLLTRLGLSFDMTFLAFMLSSANDSGIEIKKERCIAHVSKRPVVKNNEIINYTADMSIVLAYYKLLDDIKDDLSLKAIFAILAYVLPMRRVRKTRRAEVEVIKENLNKLSKLEKENCDDLDQVAHCFANILKKLFTPSFLPKNDDMASLGYHLGRWIYIIDAFADRKKDKKAKTYNPINTSKISKEIIEQSLGYTLYTIGEYAKKTSHKNEEIVSNIIYLGLRNTQDRVMNNESV